MPGPPTGRRSWRETFATALQQYHAQEFGAAKHGFQQTLALRPDDGPSKFYLERIAELGEFRTIEGWTGEFHLKEK